MQWNFNLMNPYKQSPRYTLGQSYSKMYGTLNLNCNEILIMMNTIHGQYKIWTVDHGLRTRDCGLVIKHGLGIK